MTILLSTVVAGTLAVLLLMLKARRRKDTIYFGPFLVGGTYLVLVGLATLLDLHCEVTNAVAGALPL